MRLKPVKDATPSERIAMVREIFSSITPRYDFLNRFLSLRRDVAWRRRTVRAMRFFSTNAFLDIATGTGDLAIEAARAHPGISVTGLDFVPEMMALAKDKVAKEGLQSRIRLVEGDALNLPSPDNSFDVSAIAFGIRNIPDRARALREMARVVVPGGQVMVLELTTPSGRASRAMYGVYLNYILPLAGRLFSGNYAAYRYLAESIMDFPTADEFTALMRSCGLRDVKKTPLTLGTAHLHIGIVA